MAEPIELTLNQIKVLGRPNFTCYRIAELLISYGVYKKPERNDTKYEQAVAIHFLSGMLEKHGDNWHKEADQFLQIIASKEREKANDH